MYKFAFRKSKKVFALACAAVVLFVGVENKAYAISSTLKEKWKNLVATYPGFDPSQQSACVIDTTGKVLFAENADKQRIPASVTKVYTTDFVLSKMDPAYRFKTDLILDGKTLYINGDGDPFFIDEHLKNALTRMSTDIGKNKITTVVFYNFYFNWTQLDADTKITLKKYLAKSTLVSKDVSIRTSTLPYKGKGHVYRVSSYPLSRLLKQMNIYSTNTAAEILFDRAGGKDAFEKYMKNTYGATNADITFTSGSGLDGNSTTCSLTLRVMKHLGQKLYVSGLTFRDILPVPIIDGGSMKNRMKNIVDPKVLLVKPGFVYGAETLTGVLHTDQGNVYFGIFTAYDEKVHDDIWNARTIIDGFTKELIDEYHAKPFEYLDKPFSWADGMTITRVR